LAKPLFDRDALHRSGFPTSPTGLDLARSPMGVIDVGARWGVDELFRPAARFIHALAVEPDAEEAARVAAREADGGWAGFEIVTQALGARAERAALHLLARPNNSSLLPVDPEIARRYRLLGFEHVKDIDVELVPLDVVLFDRGLGGPAAGEVIKLDVQGAEPAVIAGARRTLAERTQCLVCEVAFFTPYRGAELFSEIERSLRGFGLSFYGFLDFQHRSTRRLDKRTAHGRERMMQADAVFFRDPFATTTAGAPAPRALAVLFLSSLLLGYYDFSLEVAEAIGGDDATVLSRVVRILAATDAATDAEDVAKLVAAGDAEARHLALARMVDRRRDFTTVHDVVDAPASDPKR
jgi:FkbM family methyltransferase